jgi:hypothetical protein
VLEHGTRHGLSLCNDECPNPESIP